MSKILDPANTARRPCHQSDLEHFPAHSPLPLKLAWLVSLPIHNLKNSITCRIQPLKLCQWLPQLTPYTLLLCSFILEAADEFLKWASVQSVKRSLDMRQAQD